MNRKRKRKQQKEKSDKESNSKENKKRGVEILREANAQSKMTEQEVRNIIKEEKMKLQEGEVSDMLDAAINEVNGHMKLGKEIAFELSKKGDTDVLEDFINARKQYVEVLKELRNSL